MYRWIQPLLFKIDPERAHHLTLQALRYIPKRYFPQPKSTPKPIQAVGLKFSHRVGLAAGLDKNGEYLDALAKLGFAFIEVGTVTPRPQEGNPKPRLFRIPKAHALINRMGFNNQGVDVLLSNIDRSHYQGILGINIGKNKDTPLDRAVEDYLECFHKVYSRASYITINISSPNTPDLRKLQTVEYFAQLMSRLRKEQLYLADQHQNYVPLFIKLSPDESNEALKRMGDTIAHLGIDGIIATNTTNQKESVSAFPYGKEMGGLSGGPLRSRSTEAIRVIKQVVGDRVTLIGVGGLEKVQDAQEKLQAGATLLQVYTGLIYQGPKLIKQLADGVFPFD